MNRGQLLDYLEKTCVPMEIPEHHMEAAVEKLARQIDEEMMVLARIEGVRHISGKGKKCS